jgi:osomolarity two-component system, sensor histidine kinase SLN1
VRARTPSTSSIGGGQSPQDCQDTEARLPSKDEEDGSGDSLLVNDVVVDRSWSSEIKISSGGSHTTSLPDADITPEYSGDSPPHKPNLHEPDISSCVDQTYFLARFVWHAARNFFYPAGYSSPESEAHYRREDWFVSKPLAVWSSLYLVVNWAMGLGFATRSIIFRLPDTCGLHAMILHRPFNKIDIIFFYGFGPLFCFPIPFMVIYNWPHHRRLNCIYQLFVTISIWMWSVFQSDLTIIH